MKTWPLIISIVVILTIVSSPALAISKSDLISQYRAIVSDNSNRRPNHNSDHDSDNNYRWR
jgi:hypothetical protein